MQVASWMVFVAGELILMFAGISVLLFFLLMRSDNRWKRLLGRAKERIAELKVFEERFETAQENLHRYMKGFAHLKEQLEEAKNNPEHLQKIEELERALAEALPATEKLVTVESSLKTAEKELEKLRNQSEVLGDIDPDAIDKLTIEVEQLRTENESFRKQIDLLGDGDSESADSSGIDLWQDDPSSRLGGKGDGQVKKFTHEFDAWQKKNKDELEKLREKSNEQRRLIFELRTTIAKGEIAVAAGEDADGSKTGKVVQTQVNRLEKMLTESDTCIQILEDELDTMQKQIGEYDAQIENMVAQLAAANSAVQGSGEEIFADNESPVSAAATEDVVFGDESETAGSNEEIEQLKGQLEGANGMAMMMMKANGDQSNVISFARNSISCHSLEELADAVLETVANYGLKAAVQVRTRGGIVNRSHSGKIKPAALVQLGDMDSSERYEENGSELLIRFPKLSVLVLGMPDGDADQFSRFRDSLAIGMELAVNEVDNIEDEYAMQKQQAVLKKIITTTRKTLENVEEQFQYQAKESKDIMDSLSYVMENDAFVKSMDPTFRKIFSDIMAESKARFDELHGKGVAVDESFSKIMESLSQRL